jgi:hypothetical protein
MKLDNLVFKNPEEFEEWTVGLSLIDIEQKQTSFFGTIRLPLGYEEAADILYKSRLDGRYDECLPASCLTEIITTPTKSGLLEFKLKVLVPRLKRNFWGFVPFAGEYAPVRDEINEPGLVGVTAMAYVNQFKDVPIVPDADSEIKNGVYVVGSKYALTPSLRNVFITGPLTICQKGTILAE